MKDYIDFNPKVSIIIPVYNGADYISEAIDSALAQTYKNIEIVVVNDGSNDDGKTEEIVKSYGDKIRYFYKENSGVGAALNLGIREMKGEYFSWLSHDDVYYPNKIEIQIKYLRKEQDRNIILYSNWDHIDCNSNFKAHNIVENVEPCRFRYKLISSQILHGCNLLIKKDCFNVVGLFNEKLLKSQDIDMWFRLSEKFQFKHIPEILIKVRQHNTQGGGANPLFIKECNDFYINCLKKVSPQELIAMSGENSLSSLYVKIALNLKEMTFYVASRYALELSQTYLLRDNIIIRLKNICLIFYCKLWFYRISRVFWKRIFKYFKKLKCLNMNNEKKNIDFCKTIHNIIYSSYDYRHIEIYNPIEQNRIKQSLEYAISQIQSQIELPLILDFGSGTGNITKNLMNLNLNIVAADISEKSLEYLKDKLNYPPEVRTLVLSGFDLSDFNDNTFDMVISYNVLNYLYDYEKILKDFVRIVKPGGIIVIDHEFYPLYWKKSNDYLQYFIELNITPPYRMERSVNFLDNPVQYIKEIIKKIVFEDFIDNTEGQLHVYKYDHIDWETIQATLLPYCDLIKEEDYLVCRRSCDKEKIDIWKKWKGKCLDMRLSIFRKNRTLNI